MKSVIVAGGGLAGSEAAWQAYKMGGSVRQAYRRARRLSRKPPHARG